MAKNRDFQHGQRVVASAQVLSNPKKASKLMARTQLSEDELRHGPMQVIHTREDGQAAIKHDRLEKPFIVHCKYFENAPTRQ